jgi:hypothetical protein
MEKDEEKGVKNKFKHYFWFINFASKVLVFRSQIFEHLKVKILFHSLTFLSFPAFSREKQTQIIWESEDDSTPL